MELDCALVRTGRCSIPGWAASSCYVHAARGSYSCSISEVRTITIMINALQLLGIRCFYMQCINYRRLVLVRIPRATLPSQSRQRSLVLYAIVHHHRLHLLFLDIGWSHSSRTVLWVYLRVGTHDWTRGLYVQHERYLLLLQNLRGVPHLHPPPR